MFVAILTICDNLFQVKTSIMSKESRIFAGGMT